MRGEAAWPKQFVLTPLSGGRASRSAFSEIRIISRGFVELIGPGVNNRVLIEVIDGGPKALLEFLLRRNADVAED
jgi:hypothetical protein